jgi:hypothetical protein
MIGASCLVLLTACDVEQTQEARLPDVNVDAEPGQVPKYDIVKKQDAKLPEVDVDVSGGQVPKFDVDVKVPDVDVQTKTVEVEVPDVDINSKKVDVKVPTGAEIKFEGEDGNDRVDD